MITRSPTIESNVNVRIAVHIARAEKSVERMDEEQRYLFNSARKNELIGAVSLAVKHGVLDSTEAQMALKMFVGEIIGEAKHLLREKRVDGIISAYDILSSASERFRNEWKVDDETRKTIEPYREAIEVAKEVVGGEKKRAEHLVEGVRISLITVLDSFNSSAPGPVLRQDKTLD